MNFIESTFINSDGIKLYRQIYQPENLSVKALVFISHGLFEHCQSNYYESIIKSLIDINCLILTHDHYGHGLSEGDRGMISNVDIFVRDVICDIEETIKDLDLSDSVPIFLYGHSLGGLISVHASLTKRNYFKGLILEAPALAHNIGNVTIKIGQCINYLYPSFGMRRLDYGAICRDPVYVDYVKNDQLRIHSKVSAMTGLSILASIDQCVDLYGDVDIPVMIGHGDADILAPASGSRTFMERIASTDKTIIIYPGAKHQLRNETDNVDVEFTSSIVQWIKERIN